MNEEKERKRMCLNCGHRVLRGASSYCGIDDHYMHYAEVFEGWCCHWSKMKGMKSNAKIS